MPLLLLPLVALVLLVLAAVSPLLLWRRHRAGRGGRPVREWQLALMAWSSLPVIPMLCVGAWLGQRWVPDAVTWAIGGVVAGAVLALVGVATTRVEWVGGRRWYTPDPWIPLALAVLVALKLAWLVWGAWQGWRGAGAVDAWWSSRAVLFALGGLLAGHAVFRAWGLRWRLRARTGARRRRG